MKIEIKERKLTEGKKSLYLEYYESGYRKRENLHLYLLPDCIMLNSFVAAKNFSVQINKVSRHRRLVLEHIF